MSQGLRSILINSESFNNRVPFNGQSQDGHSLFDMICKLEKNDEIFAQIMDAIVWESENNYRTNGEHISSELCKIIFAAIQNRVDSQPDYGKFAIRVLNRIMVGDEQNCMRTCILKCMEVDVKNKTKLKVSNNKRYICTVILLSEFYRQVKVQNKPFQLILEPLLECLTDLLSRNAQPNELKVALEQLHSLRYIFFTTCTKVQWVAIRNSIKDSVIFNRYKLLLCCFGWRGGRRDTRNRGTREDTVELVMLSRIKVAERELREQEARERSRQSLNDFPVGEHSPIIRENPCHNEMSREKADQERATFFTTPSWGQSIDKMPGYGEPAIKKLKQAGLLFTDNMIGKFLSYRRDNSKFALWIMKTTGLSAYTAVRCAKDMQMYCESYL